MQVRIRRQPGSEIAGRAGVGDQGDLGAALDRLGELERALVLVALVVGDQPRRLHLEPLEQPPRPTGVLAGDDVGLRERAAHARGEVLHVPDRGRADGKAPRRRRGASADRAARLVGPRSRGRHGHQCLPLASSSSAIAIAAAPIIPAFGAHRAPPRPAPRSSAAAPGRAAPRAPGRAAGRRRRSRRRRSRSRRVEDVGEARERDAEPAADQRDDVARGLVARERRLGDRLPVDLARRPRAASPRAESGSRSRAARPSRPSAVPEAKRLDAAAVRDRSPGTGRPVDLDHDVPELGAGAGACRGRARRRAPGRRRSRSRSSASPCSPRPRPAP